MSSDIEITDLLEFSLQQGASDLHLSAGEPPMIRKDGEILKIDLPVMSEDRTQEILYDIMGDRQRKIFEEKNEIDFSIAVGEDARFRVNIFKQFRGLSAVFRLIPTTILSLEDLLMPSVIKKLVNQERGLILVTGPTGCGKSTTLAAMIDYINKTRRKHILTIEDPIEFLHTPINSLINQRELGSHTHAFAEALRSALREDPDVILVGEMRDLETISLALTAAETGHLVLATLHTSSAPKTIDRIIDVFPGTQQSQVRAMLADSLIAVITQTLCKRKKSGMIAALEIMVGSNAVRSMIREGKLHQLPGIMQSSQSEGMKTLEMSLIQLVEKNYISIETAIEKGLNPQSLSTLQATMVGISPNSTSKPIKNTGTK